MTSTRPALVIEDPTPTPAAATTSASDIFEAPAAPAAVVEPITSSAVIDEDGSAAAELPARAIRNEDGSVTLPLVYPVALQVRSSSGTVRTETFEALTLHRLTGKDIRLISAAPAEGQPAVLLACSTRLRPAIAHALFDQMDASDVRDMTAVATHFFDGGRKTPK
ncbi:hypothetical protein K9U40_10305 [Xanthobacter autotrophicus]|uniref:hypothetical protein n=1 Tax=Xanthobacter TaxID=279 RepID=UPI0024AC13A9|nr:hypothetical protein [Xanthobacter autotrophicus]MDI4664717.1 hypothetical protein [Xanthobacter autotrophicus]